MTLTRMTAGERRRDLLEMASDEFAVNGYHGTSTEEIARRAGVSQPYLFRLFGTKRALFLAAVHECFDTLAGAFEEAAQPARAAGGTPPEILRAMGLAYAELLRDRTLLRLQLQAYAASGDALIRAAVRAEFDRLYTKAADLSGATDESLHGWFAEGMVMNVQAALAGDQPAEDLLVARGGWLARLPQTQQEEASQ